MKRLMALTTILLANISSTDAIAQTSVSSEEESGEICILVAYRWDGSPQETRQIRRIPVPESFKLKKGGACGGVVDAAHLIRWHLRYGSEETVWQALRYIEKRDGAAETIAARLGDDLTRSLAELKKELRIESASADTDLDFSQPNKLRSFFADSPAVNTLGSIKSTLNSDLLERISLYLSAAEIFRSKRLAAHAQGLFASHQTIETKMLPTRDGGDKDIDPRFQRLLNMCRIALAAT